MSHDIDDPILDVDRDDSPQLNLNSNLWQSSLHMLSTIKVSIM